MVTNVCVPSLTDKINYTRLTKLLQLPGWKVHQDVYLADLWNKRLPDNEKFKLLPKSKELKNAVAIEIPSVFNMELDRQAFVKWFDKEITVNENKLEGVQFHLPLLMLHSSYFNTLSEDDRKSALLSAPLVTVSLFYTPRDKKEFCRGDVGISYSNLLKFEDLQHKVNPSQVKNIINSWWNETFNSKRLEDKNELILALSYKETSNNLPYILDLEGGAVC